MLRRSIFGVFLIVTSFGCVDRIFFDITIPENYGISISGFISDQPGPYQVTVLRTFDTESLRNLRSGVSGQVVLHDAEGNSEIMKQVDSGVYETAIGGTQGKVGGIYSVTVELEDGRIYESRPDTMYPGASMDNIHYKFTNRPAPKGIQYEFEIYGQTSTEVNMNNVHFMWRNKTTFKSKTKPESEPGKCYRDPERGICNYVNPCTGLKNVGNDFQIKFKRIGPCTCCICWYDAYNPKVILSDKVASVNGQFPEMLIDRVPVNGWYLMYKMRVEVSIQSLSIQSYRFWKGIRDQYDAVSNIFQPITGKIPGNFVQTAGDNSPAKGAFWATSISSKYFYIEPTDINPDLIPSTEYPGAGLFPCFDLYPNSTNVQPAFWVE